MQRKLERISKGFRIAAVLLLVGLLYIGVSQLLDYYSDQVGFTPEKAVQAYFAALSRGDYDEVYRLTNKDHLTDIYGRKITEQEFRRQVQSLFGNSALPVSLARVDKLFEKDQCYYYVVELSSEIGGSTGKSRLIVEVQQRDGTWVITYPFGIVL